ncbi:MAG: molybdopterin cofactor-binding domain-containing protein [Sphingorhabdus sp.]
MMGVKRRAFLVGSAALMGGGLFAVYWGDNSARKRAVELTAKGKDGSFLGWMKIGEDDIVTVYSPHIDFGQGSQTALAQMLADELDADWSKVKVEHAPADPAFANSALGRGFISDMVGYPGVAAAMPASFISMMARSMNLQTTGGSSAVRFTGQHGMRVVGAAARAALVAEAADRLKVPATELTTLDSRVIHAKSNKSLRYGELAQAAAGRSLNSNAKLKDRKEFRYIGQGVQRLDIPAKVDGSAIYGIDFTLPDMRVATIMMAPVRDGKLTSVDPAPAMAVNGVEKVIKLDDAVVVIAKGYWQATKGLQALAPKFTDGGHGNLSTASIFAAQDKLNATGAKLTAPAGGKVLTGDYKAPFLHQAMMEPFALTAHHKDGRLDIWGGLQDPLAARMMAAESAGLDAGDVMFHPMIMGGGFGRRFPPYSQIIDQIAKIAMQVPYPVKLIWSREEELKHGAYRPQVAAGLQAGLGSNKRMTGWTSDYAQFDDAGAEATVPYTIPNFEARHHEYISNQVNAYWRSVNASQHGFFNESFVDELAHEAGEDPYQFRRNHLKAGSRQLLVLDTVAQRSGWGKPLPEGHALGIAMVESFGTIVAEVVEASVNEDGTPKIHKAWAVVDCGTTVNPLNAAAQIEGGIIMGLSAAIGEQINIDKGVVVESNFSDYPILKLADAPDVDVHFIESGAKMGGIGEPGLPPAAPALANALFALTGKRIRQLPILNQVKA